MSRLRERFRPVAFAAGFVMCTGTPSGLSAQRLVGEVIDAETRAAIPGSIIVAHDAEEELVGVAFADSLGRYSLRVDGTPPYRVAARAPGYAPLEAGDLRFAEDVPTLLHFEMTAEPLTIDGVEVVAKAGSGLAETLTILGLSESELAGRLVGPEELARMPVPQDFGAVVERLGIPGVDVTRGGSSGLCVHQQRGRRGNAMERCGITVLDGVVVLTPVEATQLYGLLGGGGAVLLFTRDGAGG